MPTVEQEDNMRPLLVFRKGISFEFPKEVLDICKLRPNQKLSGKQFWQALTTDAKLRLELADEEIVYA